MSPTTDKGGMSLRLTLSAAAITALLAGGTAGGATRLFSPPQEDPRVAPLVQQVAELREQNAANAVRFEAIRGELAEIKGRLPRR